MGQGNLNALKTTLESFKHICNEVIFGDLLIFDSDRDKLKDIQKEYNLKVVELPFNYIFINGFAETLNTLASHSTNNIVIYMNVGEIIDSELRELDTAFDAWCFDHANDPHKWHRIYDKTKFSWSGVIHEEIIGNGGKSNEPVFRMRDTEKDIEDPFYSKVMNDIKELTYFNQYFKIIKDPENRGATNIGWVNWAKDQEPKMEERLNLKGHRLTAFQNGDKSLYLSDIFNNFEFETERMESNQLINFQGDRMLLG